MTAPSVIAVTGGTGFVGRSVLSILVERGYRVRALTRSPREDDKIDWIHGDLQDTEALGELAHGADGFIHIAGLTKASHISKLLEANSQGAGEAASAARAANVRRFVLVSSIAAREPHLSDYAYSKRAGERAVKAAAGEMELVIVRPPAILGPGDDATAPVLGMMRRGWLPVPAGKARQEGRMSFVYMEDVARFLVEQLDAPLAETGVAPILTPCGPEAASGWNDLAAAASTVLSRRVRMLPISPVILAPAALMTQITCAVFGGSTFFNAGKVREMLHNDWTGDSVIAGARNLEECLRLAYEMDPPNETARNESSGGPRYE